MLFYHCVCQCWQTWKICLSYCCCLHSSQKNNSCLQQHFMHIVTLPSFCIQCLLFYLLQMWLYFMNSSSYWVSVLWVKSVCNNVPLTFQYTSFQSSYVGLNTVSFPMMQHYCPRKTLCCKQSLCWLDTQVLYNSCLIVFNV